MKSLTVSALVLWSSLVGARELTWMWDPSVTNPPADSPNAGYDNAKTFYEFRTKLNTADWDTTITEAGVLTLTKSIPLVPDDALTVQIRARAPESWICDRATAPDCDKSDWVSYDVLPTIDTPVIYPRTPIVTIAPLGQVISPSIPFVSTDVGGSTPPGSIIEQLGSYTVTAGGGDIWGTSDSYFNASVVTNRSSFVLTAKVVSFSNENTSEWSKIGLIVREDLTPSSKNVAMITTPYNGVALQWRTTSTASTNEIMATGMDNPVWLKLEKNANIFTGSYSLNGIDWTVVGSTTVSMAGTVYPGIAGSRNANTAGPITAILSNVTGF